MGRPKGTERTGQRPGPESWQRWICVLRTSRAPVREEPDLSGPTVVGLLDGAREADPVHLTSSDLLVSLEGVAKCIIRNEGEGGRRERPPPLPG